MNLVALLDNVPCLGGYYDRETGAPLDGPDLFRTLMVEALAGSFDPAADDDEQLSRAIETVERIAGRADEIRALLAEARAALPPGYIVDGLDVRAKVLREGTLRHLTPNQIRYGGSVGKLLDGKFACHACALGYEPGHAAEVYPINIIPYSQPCHDCGKVVVEGWPCQLFDAPGSVYAAIRLNRDGLPEVDPGTFCTEAADAYAAAVSGDISAAKADPVIGLVRCEVER